MFNLNAITANHAGKRFLEGRSAAGRVRQLSLMPWMALFSVCVTSNSGDPPQEQAAK
jgi:hypothetical protein